MREQALRQREAEAAFNQQLEQQEEARRQQQAKRQEAEDYLRALEISQQLADQSIAEGEAAGALDVADFGTKRLSDLMAALGQKLPCSRSMDRHLYRRQGFRRACDRWSRNARWRCTSD